MVLCANNALKEENVYMLGYVLLCTMQQNRCLRVNTLQLS
jgi:hypothetical protein